MSRQFGHSPLDFRFMSPAIRFLVVTNVVGFILYWLNGNQMLELFGLVPQHVWRDRWVWQPVTYLFLHGTGMHLLLNLFSIWMFAMPIEGQWGPREFMKYYLICGIGAGLLSVLFSPHSSIPIVGASGAIFGLLVAFAMLYPDAVVYLYFFFPIKARDMAILYGVIEFFAGATSATPGVARFTHLGGMVIGFVYLRYWGHITLRAGGLWRRLTGGSRADEDVEEDPYKSRPRRRKEPPPPDPMAEIDRILDKISEHGKESLSEEELEILRKVSERKEEKQ